jgi:hypothetical protein
MIAFIAEPGVYGFADVIALPRSGLSPAKVPAVRPRTSAQDQFPEGRALAHLDPLRVKELGPSTAQGTPSSLKLGAGCGPWALFP